MRERGFADLYRFFLFITFLDPRRGAIWPFPSYTYHDRRDIVRPSCSIGGLYEALACQLRSVPDILSNILDYTLIAYGFP